MSQLESPDLTPRFIFTSIPSANVGRFRLVFLRTEMSKKIFKEADFFFFCISQRLITTVLSSKPVIVG